MAGRAFVISPYALLAAGALVVAASMALLSHALATHRDRLAAEGVAGVAVVERLAEERGHGAKPRRFLVDVAIVLPDGGRWLHREQVGDWFFEGLSVGDRLPVRYLPADPSINDIVPDAASGALAAWVAAALAAALGGLALARGRRFP